MSTRKFIYVVVTALLVFVAIVSTVAFAVAEDSVYCVDAVVISWKPTLYEDLEVEVVDEEGNLWGYYVDADEHIRIGDVVILTVFDFGNEEDNEIIDATCVDHLNILEMVQWLCR